MLLSSSELKRDKNQSPPTNASKARQIRITRMNMEASFLYA
jgi:hypothetical protein